MHIARYVILNTNFVWLISSLDVIQQVTKEISIYQFWEEYSKFSEVTSIVIWTNTDTPGHGCLILTGFRDLENVVLDVQL